MKTILFKLLLLVILLSYCTYQGVSQPTDCVPTSGENATLSFGSGIIPTFNGAPLPSGTYISVMFNTPSGQKCAGFTQWQNMPTGIAATGASGTLEGYASGETYKFRLQLPNGTVVQNNNITVTYKPVDIICDNGGTYKKDGLSCIQSFNAEMTSASEELINERVLALFPNPSSGIFKITSENNKIERLQLVNLEGKQIQMIYQNENNTIDLSHLSPGTYMLKGFINNYPFAKNVVIVR